MALGEARLCLAEAQETRDQRIQKARAELEAAGNRLESLRRRLSELEEDLGKTVLRAQHAGALFSHGNGKFSVGYPVYRGQIVADLADTSSLLLEARVRECDSQLVKEGQKVVVHLLSLLEEPLTGTVAEVGTSLTEDQSNSEVRYLGAEVTLDAVPPGAKPGMNAYADITVEAIPSALVVPCAAVEGGIVTVLTGSGPERREVEVLAVDGLFAAVKGPVAEGEWVVLNARE